VHTASEIHPILIEQPQVQKQQINFVFSKLLAHLLAVCGEKRLKTMGGEQIGQKLSDLWFIINDKHVRIHCIHFQRVLYGYFYFFSIIADLSGADKAKKSPHLAGISF